MNAERQAVDPADLVDDAQDQAMSGEAGELEALRQEAARNYAGWQRAQADYENMKRRSAQDVRDRVQQAQRGILLDLLDLADDFERAEREAPSGEADDPWRQSLVSSSEKLRKLLDREQVALIGTEDQSFDPELHEAVGQLPGRQEEIVAVLRTGYRIGPPSNARVLRATQVLVGDGSIVAPEEPEETGQPTEPADPSE